MQIDANKQQYSLDDLLQIMSIMRNPEIGCKWTQEQSWKSLVHHTIEEAYEIVDAIENGGLSDVKSELADMLNQIVFYSQIAQENNEFNFADVVTHLSKKLISRHPNVFSKDGSDKLSYRELEFQWEQIKNQEKKNNNQVTKSILDGVVKKLPALTCAQKLQKKAASVGFDWDNCSDILPKLGEEVHEFECAYAKGDIDHALEEVGDIMFTCVNLLRHLGADAETVMRKANKKFDTRFRKLESILDLEKQENLSKEVLGNAWNIAKLDLDGSHS